MGSLAACSGGGGSSDEFGVGIAPPPPDGGSGGGAQPTAVGDEVGSFELAAPSAGAFILHGTMPIPPGVYPRSDGQNPFALLDQDGTPVNTQVEVVAWYPDKANDGASIVELIAAVRRPSGSSPGQRINYQAVIGFTPETSWPNSPSVSDLSSGPAQVKGSILALVNDTSSIEVSTKDVFGHTYSMRPLEAQGFKMTRYGKHHTQVRTYDTMLPNSSVSGPNGTLDHMMGVHSYISTLNGQDVLLLDLRLNNGPDGNDNSTSIDDPMGKVYFERIEVAVPQGYVVLQAFDDPMWGNNSPATIGGKTRYQLVEPLPNNKLHVMEPQAQMIRHLAIVPAGSEAAGRAMLEQEGLAFCRRGTDSGIGSEYYSWWNEQTARYFPQSHILPSLEHMGHGSLRNTLKNEFISLRNKMTNGNGTGSYPVQFGNLGWAHPYGVAYGGMTGGNEIYMYQGVRAVEAASVEGYQHLQLWHRMHTDREPNVLYAKNGEPTRVTDWVKTNGSIQYTFYFYGSFNGSGPDPFGYSSAPNFQVQAVANQGRKPDYENQLVNFDPHDLQHSIRYTHPPKALVYIGNDQMARDSLHMQAEIFRLGYNRYANQPNGTFQETNMGEDIWFVTQFNSAAGFKIGRGEGWGTDTMNVAYATGTDAFRSELRGWYEELVQLMFDGQALCSGFIQAQVAPKMLDGDHRARQAIEQAILENALKGVLETVFRGVSATHTVMLEDILEKSYYAWTSPMAWDSAKNGPYAIGATGPQNESLPPWCVFPGGLSNLHTTYTDTYQLWSSFGYAFKQTGDPIFLNFATDMIGGGNLLNKLQSQGANNIYNRAALIARVQKDNGVF